MKRAGDDPSVENEKKCKKGVLCTPFCDTDCAFRGEHNNLILTLVGLQESNKTCLEQWKALINGAKDRCDLNWPLIDPDLDLCYPLLHWAAILGKVKAFKWLLQQEFIDLIQNNPADPVCSLPNMTNKTVLFSAVRYLHEGVKTRETHHICKVLVKLVDILLKHDPDVLLVQGHNNDTVLHLCARREEGSNAPFFSYLRRILGKLHEHSEKKRRVPLKDILERKNEAGDTFLHLLAKSDDKEEARDLIRFAKDKFFWERFIYMKNVEGKTADEILNEIKPNPSEEFLASSQEKHQSPLPLRAADYDDEDKDEVPPNETRSSTAPLQSFNSVARRVDQVSPVPDDEGTTLERIMKPDIISKSQWNNSLGTNARSDNNEDGENKIDMFSEYYRPSSKAAEEFASSIQNTASSFNPHEEIPRLIITLDQLSEEMRFHSASSSSGQLVSDKSGARDPSVMVKESNECPGKECHPDAKIGRPVGSEISVFQNFPTEGVSDTNTLSKAKDTVKKLIRETESELFQDKNKLEEARWLLIECEQKMKQLREEKDEKEATVQRLKEKVEAKVKQLNSYQESLSKLV